MFPSGLNEECPCRVAEHQPLTILAVLSSLPVSRRTLAKIKQNLSWAFGYNLVDVPLAAWALMPSLGLCLMPSISGALMGLETDPSS